MTSQQIDALIEAMKRIASASICERDVFLANHEEIMEETVEEVKTELYSAFNE